MLNLAWKNKNIEHFCQLKKFMCDIPSSLISNLLKEDYEDEFNFKYLYDYGNLIQILFSNSLNDQNLIFYPTGSNLQDLSCQSILNFDDFQFYNKFSYRDFAAIKQVITIF